MKVDAMKVEVTLHAFQTLDINGGERSVLESD
jgi:hypothetical protein